MDIQGNEGFQTLSILPQILSTRNYSSSRLRSRVRRDKAAEGLLYPRDVVSFRGEAISRRIAPLLLPRDKIRATISGHAPFSSCTHDGGGVSPPSERGNRAVLYESRGTDSRQQGCPYMCICVYLGEEKSWKGEFWIAENFDEIPLVVSYPVFSSLV